MDIECLLEELKEDISKNQFRALLRGYMGL